MSGVRAGSGGLRAAVIGCGAISHQHLAHLRDMAEVQLIAVCDRSAALAEFAQDRYGARRSFTDVGVLLESCRPDVVHVLTPPHTHVSIAEAALGSGAHVIVEKPIAPDLPRTRQLLETAHRHGRRVVESRNLLFNDEVRRLDDLVRAGRLGQVKEVDVLLALDLNGGPFGDPNLTGPGVQLAGGAVHDFLPHLAYLALHFLGPTSAPTSVVGQLSNLGGNPRVGADHLDALVRVGTGRARLRVASDLMPDAFRLTVRGDGASATTDLYHPFSRVEGGRYVGKLAPAEQVLSGAALARSGLTNLRNKVAQHGPYHGLPRMLDEVYRAFASGGPLPVSDDELLASAALVDRLVGLADDSVVAP